MSAARFASATAFFLLFIAAFLIKESAAIHRIAEKTGRTEGALETIANIILGFFGCGFLLLIAPMFHQD